MNGGLRRLPSVYAVFPPCKLGSFHHFRVFAALVLWRARWRVVSRARVGRRVAGVGSGQMSGLHSSNPSEGLWSANLVESREEGPGRATRLALTLLIVT